MLIHKIRSNMHDRQFNDDDEMAKKAINEYDNRRQRIDQIREIYEHFRSSHADEDRKQYEEWKREQASKKYIALVAILAIILIFAYILLGK